MKLSVTKLLGLSGLVVKTLLNYVGRKPVELFSPISFQDGAIDMSPVGVDEGCAL